MLILFSRRKSSWRLPSFAVIRPMLGWNAAKPCAVGKSPGYAMADMLIKGSLTSNGLPMN